jgi:hypothetical protein
MRDLPPILPPSAPHARNRSAYLLIAVRIAASSCARRLAIVAQCTTPDGPLAWDLTTKPGVWHYSTLVGVLR